MAFAVAAKWVAREGEEEKVAGLIERMVGPSRAEPGSIMYQAHRDPENPRVFFFYEQYVDRAAFDAHVQTEHFQTIAIPLAIPLLESRERGFYETWDI